MPKISTHGWSRTPEHTCWLRMVRRCTKPSSPDYKRYGARGISVCERWRSDFAAFLADMGPRPSSEHSIDRINNDGNYEPANCRWATMEQQRWNRRVTIHLTHNGITRNVGEWSAITGIPKKLIQNRLQRGWSPEKTLTTSRNKTEARAASQGGTK